MNREQLIFELGQLAERAYEIGELHSAGILYVLAALMEMHFEEKLSSSAFIIAKEQYHILIGGTEVRA